MREFKEVFEEFQMELATFSVKDVVGTSGGFITPGGDAGYEDGGSDEER